MQSSKNKLDIPLGLSEANKLFIQSVLSEFFKKSTSFSVFIFGSRATGRYRQYSDLDLWIESTPPLSAQNIDQLHTLFKESDLPIKVDIVTPQTCLSEYFDSIQSQKIKWFGT